MKMDWKRIGEILEGLGLIDRDGLKAAVDEQSDTGELLGEVLVRRSRVSPQDMAGALAMQFGIEQGSSGGFPDEQVCLPGKPSAEFLKHNSIVPVAVSDKSIKAAMARPQDPWPAAALRALTGLSVQRAVATESDIQEAIARLYDGRKDLGSIIDGMDEKEGFETVASDVESLKEAALEAPVINLVNIIIQRAIEKRASDIHIEPFESTLKVRYRVDGILYLSESLPRKLQSVVASRIKLMARLNIAERRLPQDGRIAFGPKGSEVDIRVSTIPTLFGESVVMRLLDQKGVLTMRALGFRESAMEAFSRLIRQPHGMVLVTGPTGSGKSTTLYAALSAIDSSAKKVVTIEDPVEYNIEGVNQIQVKPQIGFTFANGLRSIVRQDPDVIMVGEIRDAETAGIAIHSALTGHLIFSSLHTNDAPGAAARLLDMGVEGYLISSSFLGVLAQRLVRVLCGKCKSACKPGDREKSLLEAAGLCPNNGVGLFRGLGCEDCGGTGYAGRTGIFELMVMTDSLRALVSERKGSGEIKAAAVAEGMAELRADGLIKALDGITTIEEVERVTLD